MVSELSYSEYKAWCMSRFPEVCRDEAPPSLHDTYYSAQGTSDEAPVTVRSAGGGVVLTPAPKGSR